MGETLARYSLEVLVSLDLEVSEDKRQRMMTAARTKKVSVVKQKGAFVECIISSVGSVVSP